MARRTPLIWASLGSIQAFALSILSYLLDFLLWIFWGEASFLQPGQSPEAPLEMQAVPGLVSLLDVALFRAVEAELTGTLTTGHALLQAWLDVQRQARRVLRFVKEHVVDSQQQQQQNSQAPHNHPQQSSEVSVRRAQLESFARACFEGACDVLEKMSTDRFAQTANLSDPFEGASLNAAPGQPMSESRGGAASGTTTTDPQGASQHDFILASLQEASWDTGRRRLPVQQRPRDCWETSRLLCPDYVWGDEVLGLCQKTTRHLFRHPFCSVALNEWQTNMDDVLTQGGVGVLDSNVSLHHGSSAAAVAASASSAVLTSTLEREEAQLLLQLVFVDVPTRMTLFRAALEAESVVTKRLYLVKSEYRAPLRAFWEAHSSVQRAPSLDLVQDSLQRLSSSGGSAAKEKRPKGDGTGAPKDEIQNLMENAELVKLLAMERQMEQYELDMALALYPFCELARYLDQKRANPRRETVLLRETLVRLKNILVPASVKQKSHSDHTVSVGIRPLLLDLQGVPRDEEEDTRRGKYKTGDIEFLNSKTTLAAIDVRLWELVEQLTYLAKLCSDKQKKHAFYSDKKTDIDPPTAADCHKFDGQLFTCYFKDWYSLAVQQHELTTTKILDPDTGCHVAKMDALAEEIRRAEMAVSLSMVSTEPALRKVKDRVEMITSDRTKRFDFLKEGLEDLCLREMNLHVNVKSPPVNQVLELKPTDYAQIPALAGVFGIPLLRAKQSLPLG